MLKVLSNNQEIPATGSALVPRVRLRVTSPDDCAEQGHYRFRNALITVVRRGRPVIPSMIVNQPDVNLVPWTKYCQPGDHITFFISYHDIAVVAADGSLQPYSLPKRGEIKGEKFDIRTDQAKGISFTWPLLKP
ncbi:hypothetical protein [Hymenobacter sp. GOD-10R]|uniref:hypothetical protein n=1 Tax=Hymenobacter sp. GOD-10R TaxID=3093922 RepID=UPI002D78F775|nr:hypothetical protein [Hymenobacter sp. GOD-10R]WRQ30767.1 hypothetical protein SD425_10890 [Hymenobacter sp. GOD-10R]